MFTIYTKPDCNFCVKAKDLLNLKGEPFLEIDVSENVDAKERSISPDVTKKTNGITMNNKVGIITKTD